MQIEGNIFWQMLSELLWEISLPSNFYKETVDPSVTPFRVLVSCYRDVCGTGQSVSVTVFE